MQLNGTNEETVHFKPYLTTNTVVAKPAAEILKTFPIPSMQ